MLSATPKNLLLRRRKKTRKIIPKKFGGFRIMMYFCTRNQALIVDDSALAAITFSLFFKFEFGFIKIIILSCGTPTEFRIEITTVRSEERRVGKECLS